MSCEFINNNSKCAIVSCPDPTLCKEKGLAHFKPFLVFADSTVQDPGLPIRLQACDFSCDKAITLCNTTQYRTIHYHTCYDKKILSIVWHRRLDDDVTVHGIGSVRDCH